MRPPTDAAPHTTDWRWLANSCDSPCARSTISASAMTLATAMAAEATSMHAKPCHTPVTHVDMKNHAAEPTSPAAKMYGRRL